MINTNPTLYCMCGVAGSGKSTFAKLLENSNTVIIATDSIRKELYGDESEQGDYREVFNTAFARIKDNLDKGFNVVFDATNTRIKYRKNLLNSVRDCVGIIKVIYVINTPLEEALNNNNKRSRKVPELVINNQYNKFETPTTEEGWDAVHFIDYFDDKGEAVILAELF